MKGGKARTEALSAERRREIARKAAEARWAAKRGWSMTVCIAALYGDGAGVVLAADGMVTAQLPIGYEFEHQENTKLVRKAATEIAEAAAITMLEAELPKMVQEYSELPQNQVTAESVDAIAQSSE